MIWDKSDDGEGGEVKVATFLFENTAMYEGYRIWTLATVGGLDNKQYLMYVPTPVVRQYPSTGFAIRSNIYPHTVYSLAVAVWRCGRA